MIEADVVFPNQFGSSCLDYAYRGGNSALLHLVLKAHVSQLLAGLFNETALIPLLASMYVDSLVLAQNTRT